MRKLLNTLYVTTPETYLALDGENVVVLLGEEEKLRLLRMLAWGGIAVFFGCVGFVFLAALVCVVFWEEHRVLALSLVTLTFWLVAGWAAWRVQTSARSAASFLSASLAELQRDVEALRVQAQQAAASSEREQP